MEQEYRVAISGIGAAARKHAMALDDIENASLVAGSCHTESKGQEFGEKFNCTWYDETEKMLDVEEPDILNICTPSGAHHTDLELAAERGIDVLCEKPLNITTDRVDKMITLAEDAGIRLGGIFQRRYKPIIQDVREAIVDGRVGEIALMSVYNPRWRDDEYYGPERWQGTADLDGGGALINQTIHGVDQLQWLAQASMPSLDPTVNPVEKVYGFRDNLVHPDSDIEVEDTAVAVLKYRDGSLGQILAATSAYPGSNKRIHMAGRDGTIEVVGDELTSWEFREKKDHDDELRSKYSGSDDSSGGASDPSAIDYSLFTSNIKGFLEAVDANEPFLIDAREARKAVEIVEAVYESTKSDQPVTIPE